MMLSLVIIGWLFAVITYNSEAVQYMELTRIEVCSITFSLEGALDDLFTDDYTLDLNSNTASFTTSGDHGFFWDEQKGGYCFYYPNHVDHGDIHIYLKRQLHQRNLFQDLWLNSPSNGGSCDCSDSSSPQTTTGNWQLEGLSHLGTPSVALCSEWTLVDGNEPDEVDSFTTADEWGCGSDCDLFINDLTINYQGFEVFTDDDHCIKPVRRTGDGFWRCDKEGCAENYHVFRISATTYITPPPKQARHKCRNCQEYFGNNCKFCDEYEGCGECTEDASQDGFGTIPEMGECPWQYCGLECCGNDTIIPSPTVDPNCVEEGPVGGGTGSTDYNCDDHDERAEASDDFYGGNGFYGNDAVGNTVTGRYILPLTINDQTGLCLLPTPPASCIGDCDNKVAMKCPNPIEDPNCVECNDQPSDLRGCKTCKCNEFDTITPDDECNSVEDEYYWYSNAAPCAACSDIANCRRCQNNGDYGGGGCAECDPNYHAEYDEAIGIFFCALNPGASSTPSPAELPPSPDGWPGLTCPLKCESRRGDNDYCNCGCDCNTCEQLNRPYPPIDEPENPYCLDCEYHSGCGQCHNNNEDSTLDFFMPTKEHECLNCSSVFGTRCSHCDDFFGCAQCEPGYVHTYSNCCDLWYCELATVTF